MLAAISVTTILELSVYPVLLICTYIKSITNATICVQLVTMVLLISHADLVPQIVLPAKTRPSATHVQ